MVLKGKISQWHLSLLSRPQMLNMWLFWKEKCHRVRWHFLHKLQNSGIKSKKMVLYFAFCPISFPLVTNSVWKHSKTIQTWYSLQVCKWKERHKFQFSDRNCWMYNLVTNVDECRNEKYSWLGYQGVIRLSGVLRPEKQIQTYIKLSKQLRSENSCSLECQWIVRL